MKASISQAVKLLGQKYDSYINISKDHRKLPLENKIVITYYIYIANVVQLSSLSFEELNHKINQLLKAPK